MKSSNPSESNAGQPQTSSLVSPLVSLSEALASYIAASENRFSSHTEMEASTCFPFKIWIQSLETQGLTAVVPAKPFHMYLFSSVICLYLPFRTIHISFPPVK